MEQDLTDRMKAISSELNLIIYLLDRDSTSASADVLVSCTEAARLLGKSAKTVSMMIRDGRLNKEKIGDSTGIRLSEIWKLKSS